ncbi:hypothetical protein FSARC_7608 [Fusarium sarcochroum]|uniref:Protein kinase domain-containing protein n=1 Tax=Fusarium sarcochroum TaxID=1208366 RepID=A0A8H4TUU7_9HYPO|nr:hypothetical protein FSARC_7608 [Fusarium sarcochroum]
MAESVSTAQHARKDPYPVGSILYLNVVSDTQTPQNGTKRKVRVKRQIQPCTLSCGLVVEILDDTDHAEAENESKPNREAFLKLYDWRFAQGFREDNCVGPWSREIEHKYLTGLVSGKVQKFIYWLNDDESSGESSEGSQDDWEAEEEEAYLYNNLIAIYEAEVAIYARLSKYQGDAIPSLLGQVTLNIPSENFTLDKQQQHFYHVKGILLEYLPAFTLSDMIEKAPRTSWQEIVDKAVQTIHILNDNDVLNHDVRPENFIVVPVGQERYRVFMIDFGQSRLRGKNESDAEWGRGKWNTDEEGAIGLTMRMRLGKVGFELKYEPMRRYLEWTNRSYGVAYLGCQRYCQSRSYIRNH